MLWITFLVRPVSDADHAPASFGHPGAVHLELSDQTFVAVDPAAVAAVVGDPRRWPQWWPDLELEVTRDRGGKGRQWVLTGTIGGTAEIYLEPWHDGTVVHLFLRLDLSAGSTDAGRERERRALAWKRTVHRLKDELEAGRAPGTGAQVGGRS